MAVIPLSPPPSPTSSRPLSHLIAVISLVVVAASWTLAWLHSRHVQQTILTDAASQVESMAGTYAEHAHLALTIADETLQRLQDILLRDGQAAFEQAALAVSREDTNGPLNRAALIGTNGIMRANFLSGDRAPLLDVNDRAYFTTFRDHPTQRIFVNEPVLGKASGRWIILFARPVLRDGKFAGVIFVGMETHRLAGLVRTSAQSSLLVTLLSPGGRIVARSHGAENALGKIVDLPAFNDAGDSAFDLTSPVDGKTRLSAQRVVPEWGMRVVVGIERNRLDNEAREHAKTAALPALLLTLLLIPAAFLIRRAERAQLLAENARRAEALRYDSVLAAMAEGVLLIEADGRIGFANDAARKWLGEVNGQPFEQAITASGFSLVTEDGMPFAVPNPLTHLCLQSGVRLEDAWLLDTGGEQHCWLAIDARPISDENGQVLGAIATMSDRSHEHERISEAEMSRTVLSRMNDGVLITDAHAAILMVNKAFSHLSGFSESEVLGKTPAILGSERHDRAFWAEIWAALKEKGNWSGKVWNRHKDGHEYCVWHNITAVRDTRGQVARYVAVFRDITAQQAQEAELWQRANFDALTGLANRVRFEDRLKQVLHHVARHEHPFAVCYLDLDRFKPVNDNLGHAAGDALLRQVAQRMRSIVRKDDMLARIGGDEFALLMPRIKSAEDAERVASKILDVIQLPFVLDEGTASIGISIGIALYPDNGADAATLTTAADRALYLAKAEGRNTLRFVTTAEN